MFTGTLVSVFAHIWYSGLTENYHLSDPLFISRVLLLKRFGDDRSARLHKLFTYFQKIFIKKENVYNLAQDDDTKNSDVSSSAIFQHANSSKNFRPFIIFVSLKLSI